MTSPSDTPHLPELPPLRPFDERVTLLLHFQLDKTDAHGKLLVDPTAPTFVDHNAPVAADTSEVTDGRA